MRQTHGRERDRGTIQINNEKNEQLLKMRAPLTHSYMEFFSFYCGNTLAIFGFVETKYITAFKFDDKWIH